MNKSQIKEVLYNYLRIRRKPLVIQMPITSRCNSRCKTCNVWKYKESSDIDPARLKEIFQNPFFSEVRVVGMNGGEFTLVPHFIEILQAVLVLPNISTIPLITNGLYPKRLFEYTKEAKGLCDARGVHLSLCLSVDGVGEVHERVRGVPNCWSKTVEIIEEIYHNKDKYCSSFSIGCTLSRYNIEYIREIENFFASYPDLRIEYHIAVPNRRIKTFDAAEDYYVLNDEKSRLLATEFFYEKFLKARNEHEKRQMFVNYYFLRNHGKGRLCKCDFRLRDITIDENLNMALCATASKDVGNLTGQKVEDILRDGRIKTELKEIEGICDTCIHYSYHSLTIKGRLKYIHEILRNTYIYVYYEACAEKCFWFRIKRKGRLHIRLFKDYLRYIYRYIWKLQ